MGDEEHRAAIAHMAAEARAAQRLVAAMDDAAKAAALNKAAAALREDAAQILEANADDLAAARAAGLSPALCDRLLLDEARLEGVAAAVEQVARLPDPVGQVIDRSERPNGLALSRVRVPVGVIGIIFESRPNVTVDAAALAFRAGNAAILRGGSEAAGSNRALHAAFTRGLAEAGAPAGAVQLVPDQDRALVGAMLAAAGAIDMIIPRGGKNLVARVQADARVPVLAHLDGICHTYVHAAADPDMARAIALNAKLRRTGICGAMETLLIDAGFADGAGLVGALINAGCELRGDGRAQALDPRIIPASAEDWGTEYLDAVLSVAVVDGVEAAMAHIAAHGWAASRRPSRHGWLTYRRRDNRSTPRSPNWQSHPCCGVPLPRNGCSRIFPHAVPDPANYATIGLHCRFRGQGPGRGSRI